ncbi:casparian strip membrane protein 3-like [Rhodamnia argentea]|uniref:CASP-like protein n=1 Tax=Rhodamnia argentea TaxID=178133 RepID=A0A8B8NCI5_9MYRT|nr:casparian strip membrane protein 3-like [Rhodamnia argentea]
MKAGGVEAGEVARASVTRSGVDKGVVVLDFVPRKVAFVCTLESAIAMGTTDETLPFFTRFIRFRAKYDELPTFTFFVVANSVVGAYLVLSPPLSIFHIMRSAAQNSRIVLVIFDTLNYVIGRNHFS